MSRHAGTRGGRGRRPKLSPSQEVMGTGGNASNIFPRRCMGHGRAPPFPRARGFEVCLQGHRRSRSPGHVVHASRPCENRDRKPRGSLCGGRSLGWRRSGPVSAPVCRCFVRRENDVSLACRSGSPSRGHSPTPAGIFGGRNGVDGVLSHSVGGDEETAQHPAVPRTPHVRVSTPDVRTAG